jgi:hypothetical protein
MDISGRDLNEAIRARGEGARQILRTVDEGACGPDDALSSAAPDEATLMRPFDNARTIRFALVALFAAGGLLLWGELAPVDGLISFRVPPSIPSPGGAIRRAQIRTVHAVVRDESGVIVARSEQTLDNGLDGPVTPPVFLRLPRGSYTVVATISAKGGAKVALPGALSLTEAGYHRVELQRVP